MRSLLLVLLLVLAGCSAESSPNSATDPAGGPTDPARTRADEHRDWLLVGRARLDLDGDGVRDAVRVREPETMEGIEVTVDLAGRTVVHRMPHTSSLDFQPYAQADVDGEPGEELFVMSEVPLRRFVALTWRDDGFVQIAGPRDGTPLTDDFGPDLLARKWWVEGDHLVGYGSVAACPAGHDWVDCPDRMEVDAVEWRVVDGRWHTEPLGRYCVREGAPYRLRAC